MAAVNEHIVREYFELHGFFVRQQRKFVAPARHEEDEIDFLVVNPRARPGDAALPFVLNSSDLAGIARAVVAIKAYHTGIFRPSMLANTPEIYRFVEPEVFQPAARAFGKENQPTKILVIPALPAGAEARQQSIDILQSKGIDAVLPFRTVLADLIAHVQVNRNYQKSDVLQMIRLLKHYDFFREPQLELFKSKNLRKSRPTEDTQPAQPA